MDMPNVTNNKPVIRQAFLVLLFILILTYFIARAIFVSFAEYDLLEKTFAVCFLLSEGFVLFHAFGYYLNIFKLNKKRESPPTVMLKDEPSVAILIPAKDEPKSVLETTILACYNIDYDNKTIYLLDDSTDQSYHEEAAEFAKKYNIKVYSHDSHRAAKAGLINDIMQTIHEKYIVIFDADQNPMPHFLSKTLPFLEADDRLAFVQTPQFYTNIGSNHVAHAANMQQAVFFEYICEAKSVWQSMICCGTNVVIRRAALDDVHGFDESTVTEDFATSVEMQEKGWKTYYYNHILTFGMAPKNLKEYFKQQRRWAMGNVQVLKLMLRDWIKNPSSLSFMQWFEYSVTGTYFFVGWAYLFLILCPILFVVFNVPSFFMNPVIYSFSFVPYFMLAIGIFYASMTNRHYKANELFKAQVLTLMTMPVYLKAVVCGLFNCRIGFEVTAKKSNAMISYFSLWPQIILWALHLSAVSWGLLRFAYEYDPGILLNVCWMSYHLIVFMSVFYFNEEEVGL